MKKHRQTKETELNEKLKRKVAKRDNYSCLLCGTYTPLAEAHFLSRAKGGKGIEENIVTLCRRCHERYDNSAEREDIKDILKRYLIYCYGSKWNEEDLIYKKEQEE